MEGVLDKCLTPTTEMIANLIEIENAHINTNHPDFVGSADSLLNLFATDSEMQSQTSKSQNHPLVNSKKAKDSEEAQVIDDNGNEEDK